MSMPWLGGGGDGLQERQASQRGWRHPHRLALAAGLLGDLVLVGDLAGYLMDNTLPRRCWPAVGK